MISHKRKTRGMFWRAFYESVEKVAEINDVSPKNGSHMTKRDSGRLEGLRTVKKYGTEQDVAWGGTWEADRELLNA